MWHIPVWIDLFAAFGGVSLGGGDKFIERAVTTETNIFALGWVCRGV